MGRLKIVHFHEPCRTLKKHCYFEDIAQPLFLMKFQKYLAVL